MISRAKQIQKIWDNVFKAQKMLRKSQKF